jgi:hypothetical protein
MQIYFPGANLSEQKVAILVDQILSGKDLNGEAQQRVDAQNQAVNPPESTMSDIGQMAGATGNTLLDLGKGLVDSLHGDFGGAGRAFANIGSQWESATYNTSAEAQNPRLNDIIGQYGPGNIMIVDKNGNATPLTGSKSQISGLASGDLNWKRRGDQGNGIPLSQTPLQMDPNFRTDGSQTNVSFSPATVNIKVNTTTGEATATPSVVQLTPNQQQANAGVGNSTLNNPPPGDGYGYWPGKSVGLH